MRVEKPAEMAGQPAEKPEGQPPQSKATLPILLLSEAPPNSVVARLLSLAEWAPKETARARFRVTLLFTVVLVIIIVALVILTALGMVESGALIFLLGTIVGYIFSFLQRFLGLFR